MEKREYWPQLTKIESQGDLYQQSFTATDLIVDHHGGWVDIGFADEETHYLIITIPTDEDEGVFEVHFIDQINDRFGEQTQRIDLWHDRMMVTYEPGRPLISGRISYAPEIDPFEGPSRFPEKLGRVMVSFRAVDAELGAVITELSRLESLGYAGVFRDHTRSRK